MTTATFNDSKQRPYVLVSGYYGFDNLGDEAILEEITNELKQRMPAADIFVLSANPQTTAKKFGVSSIDRMNFQKFTALLLQTQLLVSGGGGLFQNTKTVGSICYYGLQMALAKLSGAKTLVYAQGIGPLRGPLAHALTKSAFRMATAVCLRDDQSVKLASAWGVSPIRSADPVWLLTPSPLPESTAAQLAALRAEHKQLIGLSLRPSAQADERFFQALAAVLKQALPPGAHLVLLPLQPGTDRSPLTAFAAHFEKLGGRTTDFDVSELTLPSQWISLFGSFDLVIAMRLHALVMALKSGVPSVGIAYDPKVTHLLTEFEQPILNMTKEPDADKWTETLETALQARESLSSKAIRKAEYAKNLACQNFQLLDKILGINSGT